MLCLCTYWFWKNICFCLSNTCETQGIYIGIVMIFCDQYHFLWEVVGHLTAIFLDQDTSNDGVRAVILSPTKELAAQTTRECRKLAKGKKFYIRLMTKKLAKSGDFSKLRCDILISTPLRLQFAIRKGKLDLSRYVSLW